MEKTLDPKAIASETCRILKERWPDMKISHHEPTSYFEGFLGEDGFLTDPPEYFPLWWEDGRVLQMEAPDSKGIYQWDTTNLTFKNQVSTADRVVALFIHDDGYVAIVDLSNGHLFQLFPTPNASIFAELLKLFFPRGREDLNMRSPGAPAVTGIYIPFIRFLDDFTEDRSELPLAPMSAVREEILSHIKEDRPWLSDLEDLTDQARDLAAKARKLEEDPSLVHLTEGKDNLLTKVRQVLEMTVIEQKRRDVQRPKLTQAAGRIPENEFLQDASQLHFVEWGIPYDDFSQGPSFHVPIGVAHSDQVFAPLIDPQYNSEVYRFLRQAINSHSQGDLAAELPIIIDLPPYAQQVEDYFIQSILMHQVPILVKQAMESNSETEENSRPSLQRSREIWKLLRNLLPK